MVRSDIRKIIPVAFPLMECFRFSPYLVLSILNVIISLIIYNSSTSSEFVMLFAQGLLTLFSYSTVGQLSWGLG